MAERPILMSAPMVRAILNGSKSQTRRVVKLKGRDPSANTPGKHSPIEPYTNGRGSWNFVLAETGHGLGDPFTCPYGTPGDRLWVREAWRSGKLTDGFSPAEMLPHQVWYEADGAAPAACDGRYRHARFMPRWASRITLEVTGVRVERLQDISEADAEAEGCTAKLAEDAPAIDAARMDYRDLWEQINGAGSWDANPFVWVVEFRRAD